MQYNLSKINTDHRGCPQSQPGRHHCHEHHQHQAQEHDYRGLHGLTAKYSSLNKEIVLNKGDTRHR